MIIIFNFTPYIGLPFDLTSIFKPVSYCYTLTEYIFKHISNIVTNKAFLCGIVVLLLNIIIIFFIFFIFFNAKYQRYINIHISFKV